MTLRDQAMGRLSEVLAPRRHSRSKWLLAAASGLLLALLPTGAFAQLVTFAPDQPAFASQVNGNFQQLKTWLEAKVGVATTSGIETPSLTTAGAVQAGSVAAATVTATNTTVSGALSVTGTMTANGTINGVNIRRKPGNNGTTNCDQYCLQNFAGFTGSCLGARLASGQYTSDCAFTPGQLPSGQEHLCLCATY